MMTNGRAFDLKSIYEIKVLGKLDQTWSDWFDGFRITCLDDESLLVGSVEDQARLLGILTKIISLGLTLVTLKRIQEADQ